MKEDPYRTVRPPLLSRRTVLAGLVGLVAASAVAPSAARAATSSVAIAAPGRTRRLALRHLHTGETIDVRYLVNGQYDAAALRRLDQFLRDHRDGTVHRIDPKVLDFLHDLTRRLQVPGPVGIVCGYRSPRTNAMLRAKSAGVAKRSLHMEGKAIDIRVPGRSVKAVAKAAMSLRRGGVGRYSRSNFVHIDSGRVRAWGA